MAQYGEKTLKRLHKAFRSGNIDGLDEEDAEILERLSFTDDQIRRVGPQAAAKMVEKKYELSSLRQAYFLVDAAQQLFGTMQIAHKAYWKGYALDKLVKSIEYISNLMDEKVERDAAGNPRIDDNGNYIMKPSDVGAWEMGAMARLIKELRETVGFSKDDDVAEKWDEAKQHLIKFTGDVRAIGITPLSKEEKESALKKFLIDDSEG